MGLECVMLADQDLLQGFPSVYWKWFHAGGLVQRIDEQDGDKACFTFCCFRLITTIRNTSSSCSWGVEEILGSTVTGWDQGNLVFMAHLQALLTSKQTKILHIMLKTGVWVKTRKNVHEPKMWFVHISLLCSINGKKMRKPPQCYYSDVGREEILLLHVR